jgi:hypothetical protein
LFSQLFFVTSRAAKAVITFNPNTNTALAATTLNPNFLYKENVMANEKLQLNELLRFNPEWFSDPVPPWIFDALDKAVLRDLALVSLERSKSIQEINIKAIDSAVAVLRKAKF